MAAVPAAFGAPAVARDREGAVQLAWLDSPEPVSERARRGAARTHARTWLYVRR